MATHRQLMTLFSKLGVDDEQRHDIIAEFTKGRTESTKDLYAHEVNELCTRLQGMLPQNTHRAQEELLLRKKRSVVLSIATRVGLHTSDDWGKFNRWMLERSILKKPLHLYNMDELNELIKQMYALEGNYNRSANKALMKAWLHRNKGIVGLC